MSQQSGRLVADGRTWGFIGEKLVSIFGSHKSSSSAGSRASRLPARQLLVLMLVQKAPCLVALGFGGHPPARGLPLVPWLHG